MANEQFEDCPIVEMTVVGTGKPLIERHSRKNRNLKSLKIPA